MRSQWNDAEDEALQGLTPEAQVIYLRGFRRYMDYRTGVAVPASFPIVPWPN